MSRDDSTRARPAVHLRQAALNYAHAGLRVFPLQPGTKVPYKDFRWREQATSDETQVGVWWDAWPESNVGIACGPGSGLTVLDLDVKGERPGLRTAAGLMGEGWQDSVPHVRTPSGGAHVWVEHQPAWGNRKLARLGLDVQGEGAYVLAPPSVLDERESSGSRGPYLTLHHAMPKALTPSPALMERMRELLGPEPAAEPEGGDEGLPEGWQDAQVPVGVEARLGRPTGAYWRHGELGPYASDSEAVYAVCVNLMGSARLTPAQCLRAVCDNTWCWAAATKPHRRSEGGLSAVHWLWEYNVKRAVPPSPFGQRPHAVVAHERAMQEQWGEPATEAELDALMGPMLAGPVTFMTPEDEVAGTGELVPRTVSPLEALEQRARQLDPTTPLGDRAREVEQLAYEAHAASLSAVELAGLRALIAEHSGLPRRALESDFARARKLLEEERAVARSGKTESLSSGYAFVEGQDAFYDLHENQWTTPRAITLTYGQDTAEAVMEACRKVKRVTYRPYNPWGAEYRELLQVATMRGLESWQAGRYVEEEGRTRLNLWRPPVGFEPKLDATDADVRPWHDAARRCCGFRPDEWEHAWRWLAYTLQYPETKVNHMLMLGGEPGIGKDWLLMPMRRALGSHNMLMEEGKALGGNFDSPAMAHSSLVLYSEVRMGDEAHEWAQMRKAYNDLKAKLSNPPEEIQLNLKNVRQFKIPNVFNVVGTTNHYDAVRLEQGDRRMFLLWGSGHRHRQPAGWDWRTAFNWMRHGEGAAVVAGWLLSQDVTDFKYGAEAPATEWKAVNREESLSPVETLVRDALYEGRGPLAGELVPAEVLLDWVRAAAVNDADIGRRITKTGLGRVMGELGLHKRVLQRPRRGAENPGQRVVYVLRNPERWMSASGPEVWAELEMEKIFGG